MTERRPSSNGVREAANRIAGFVTETPLLPLDWRGRRIWINSGDGFALTAYIERPWNFSTKNRAARAAACGRMSVTGRAGRRAVATPSAVLCFCNSRDLQRVVDTKAALRLEVPMGQRRRK